MHLPIGARERPPALIKSCPEDFVVSELHRADPPGHGDYAVIEVVKRDLPTPALLRSVAQHLGLNREQVGCAGFKDRLAITRQRLTVPATVSATAPPLAEILEWRWLGRQPEPLRPGQLRANHFRVRLRQVEETGVREAWSRQQAVGFANYYGIQRFGPRNENWETGLEMLRRPPPRAQRRRWPHNFVLNSVQSQLFNMFLAERVKRGRFQVLSPGDWCADWPDGEARPAQSGDQAALMRFEVTPLGPIWGYKLERPSAEELALLHPLGLSGESFRPFRAPGSRRATRLPLPSLELQVDGEGLVLSFELPPGSYATVLLEHFFRLEPGLLETGLNQGFH